MTYVLVEEFKVYLATPNRDATEERSHEHLYNLRSKSNLNQLEGTPFTYCWRDPKAQSTNFFWKIANTDSPDRSLGSPSTNSIPPPSSPNPNLNVIPVNPMVGTNKSNLGNNTQTNSPVACAFGNKVRTSPLDFSHVLGAPHDMPDKYFEKIPKFNGNCATSIEDHIENVWAHMEAYGAEEEDVFMRGLFASLEGDARKWFDRLLASSITRYDVLT